MKQQSIHLGFEVPSGEAVEIPLAHLCVTGQTQLSGKTTTLEALISRSGMKAIAFVTKRGEGAFLMPSCTDIEKAGKALALPNYVKPYFRHRADWQFVSDILGAILQEKLKWERANIIKVSRGAKTLRDVQANVKTQLTRKLRGIDEAIYTQLDAYFDLLLPELDALPYTDKLEISSGLNVMDLSAYTTPLQMLVIGSVLDEIYKHHKEVITVIPEAWEFVPNNKNSPAKSAAITLARKGAALGNFIWLDSQDLASVDTEVRRACSVWILGVQREQNEVKRLLTHIPGGTKKPKADDIMHLERGQFFVCHGREIHKTYVQPAWMTEQLAAEVAMGHTHTTPEFRELMNRPETPLGAPIKNLEGPVMLKVDRVNSETGARAAGFPDPSTVVLNDRVRESMDKAHQSFDEIDAREFERQKQLDKHGFRLDIDHPLDSVTFTDPSRLPPIDHNSYSKPPRGVELHRIDNVIYHIGESDMDQEERERYGRAIHNLRLTLYHTLQDSPRHNYAKDHSFEEWVNYTEGAESKRALNEDTPAIMGQQIPEEFYNEVVRRVLAVMPTNGVVKVEPREYVLSKFQREEVNRILAAVTGRSPFQRKAIAFLEAKGAGVKTSTIVTLITGKKFINMARDCKAEYEEMRELAELGLLRYDNKNGVYYPNLGVNIKRRLEGFDPSNEDVDQVIAQVLAKLQA